MTYVDEHKARLAGQIAYIDGICEHADRLRRADVARLCSRADRAQRTRRSGKAVH